MLIFSSKRLYQFIIIPQPMQEKKYISQFFCRCLVSITLAAGALLCACDRRSARLDLLACDDSIRDYVSIEPHSVAVYASREDRASGRIECRIYDDEYEIFSRMFACMNEKEIAAAYLAKGSGRFTDSLKERVASCNNGNHRPNTRPNKGRILEGLRIAVDPGHSASNMDEAKRESKYMLIVAPDGRRFSFFEAALNLATARLLKKLLEDDGATVMLTRNENRQVYPIPYEAWRRRYFRRAVMEKVREGHITAAQGRILLRTGDDRRRLKFFNSEYEMPYRAEAINAFHPHLTIMVHYDASWPPHAPIQKYARLLEVLSKSHSSRDEHMAEIQEVLDSIPLTDRNTSTVFVPGCFLRGEVQTVEDRIALLRLIITSDLDRSIQFAAEVMKAFRSKLDVPAENAHMPASKEVGRCRTGVYARNLRMTRLVWGTLCLGEPLHQNHLAEAERLAVIEKGLIPERVVQVARAYHEAVRAYVRRYGVRESNPPK